MNARASTSPSATMPLVASDWRTGLIDRLNAGGWSDSKITKMGGPAGETLRKMRAGDPGVRRDSWDKLREILDELQAYPEEYAEPEPRQNGTPKLAKVELNGVLGIERIVVEAPVDDPENLARIVAETIRGAKRGVGEDDA